MKRPTFSPPRQEAGVALLEVLVSVLLFSLGILGLIGLQARAISLSGDADDRNRAALLANEVASLMWIRNSVVVPAAELTAWEDRVGSLPDGGLPNGIGEVEVDAASAGKAADIKITWRGTTRKESEQRSQLTTRVVLP